MTPKFLIVSMNTKASIFLKNSLDNVFKDKLDIKAYSFIEGDESKLHSYIVQKPLLAMATGLMSYNYLLQYYPQNQCILGKRDISAPEYFDKLFLIPKGKKVLVINETENGVYETIEAIQQLGITHLSYVPYWQNCGLDTAGIDTAISPGMLYYCPPHIKNRVDIGMRNLSAATFIKILDTYSLGTEYIDKYITNQKKVLIDTYEKLSFEYDRSNNLRNSLQSIIDVLDEAIISIDAENKITSLNSAAITLLNIPKENALHQDVHDIFKEIPEDDSYFKGNNDLIVTINNNQIYLSYIPLSNDKTNTGILKLSKVQDIQKNEEQVRKMIYQKNKGHVAKYYFKDILTECQSMETIINDSKFFAQTDSTILITGESGTGKEMLAQSLHNHSSRANKPFIAVNFAALPSNLIESELFGYEEGAFTGAKKSGKKGLFELAHTGTIFLDEIGHASPWMQTRLLRVLEEREIMRLGDTRVIPVDIRVIAATNKNLKKMVSEDSFLADLYYRINVFQIHLPPLRNRKESIPELMSLLMSKNSYSKNFSNEALKCILDYDWFGNIRELKNMIEYSVQIAKTNVIGVDDLPYDVKSYIEQKPQGEPDNCQDIYARLKILFDSEQLRQILELLSENKYGLRKIGRNGIIAILKEKDIALSERNLRTIMKYFDHYGLVATGKTKQGTILSANGERFLQYLKTKNFL